MSVDELDPGGFPPLTQAGPVPFGRYTLLDRVAVGGMADIYVATVRSDQAPIAIKRLLPVATASCEFVEMFEQEARLLRRLSHPGLLRVFERGRIDGAHFIAMELVHGMDLRTIIDLLDDDGHRVMPPNLAAWIGVKVCDALAYAHALGDENGPLGLIHRDINPNNVMVSWDGEVKLIDFGIAKHAAQSVKTAARVIKGTLSFMSPEQAWGDRLDQRSDLFSLGACMFEMLTGRRLFFDDDRLRLLRKVRDARVRPPSALNPDVPVDLDCIVLGPLAKEPADRPRSAEVMSERLQGFFRAQGVGPTQGHVADWMRATFAAHHDRAQGWFAEVTADCRQRSGTAFPRLREDATDYGTTSLWFRPSFV